MRRDTNKHLHSRILRLIEGPTPEKTNIPRAWILGAAVVVFLSVASWMQVDAAEDPEEEEKSEELIVETFHLPKKGAAEIAEILNLRLFGTTEIDTSFTDEEPYLLFDVQR
ncbi:MAG: hypothetical protein KC964_14690 [Candidatus Omnitrophica bacterium]|nr:hypothetical protein [Candidatus Omnitrophota bacterium]